MYLSTKWWFSLPCSFVGRIFDHALEYSPSKSILIHALSVCISLLDPQSSASGPLTQIQSIRSQHLYEPTYPVNPETISAMLSKLGKSASVQISMNAS